jgi:hypothetical protein
MGCGSSSFVEEYKDISNEVGWDSSKAWVIDIIAENGEAEVNSNFLFQAEITADGSIANKTIDANHEKSYIVLDNDLYDINSFIEDDVMDGKLSFTVKFGADSPRGPTAAKGWMIKFDGLEPVPGTKNFQGTCGHDCNGSGTALIMRKVYLLRYSELSQDQKSKYPDTRVSLSHYWPTDYSKYVQNNRI